MTNSTQPKTILVVDDDPTEIKLLSGLLATHGFKIISASDAPEGLQMAIQQFPHLIILDVMMPIINGYNFCHLLKSQQKHKHIPIILLTSRGEEKDFEIGKQMGADVYLTKPVNTEELLKAVNRLLI